MDLPDKINITWEDGHHNVNMAALDVTVLTDLSLMAEEQKRDPHLGVLRRAILGDTSLQDELYPRSILNMVEETEMDLDGVLCKVSPTSVRSVVMKAVHEHPKVPTLFFFLKHCERHKQSTVGWVCAMTS
jgi:hypothetical protein